MEQKIGITTINLHISLLLNRRAVERTQKALEMKRTNSWKLIEKRK
jgi:hypothetical protein